MSTGLKSEIQLLANKIVKMFLVENGQIRLRIILFSKLCNCYLRKMSRISRHTFGRAKNSIFASSHACIVLLRWKWKQGDIAIDSTWNCTLLKHPWLASVLLSETAWRNKLCFVESHFLSVTNWIYCLKVVGFMKFVIKMWLNKNRCRGERVDRSIAIAS